MDAHGAQALVLRREPRVVLGRARGLLRPDAPGGAQNGQRQRAALALEVLVAVNARVLHRHAVLSVGDGHKARIVPRFVADARVDLPLVVGHHVEGRQRLGEIGIQPRAHHGAQAMIPGLIIDLHLHVQRAAVRVQRKRQPHRAVHRLRAAGGAILRQRSGQAEGEVHGQALAHRVLPRLHAQRRAHADGFVAFEGQRDVGMARVGAVLQRQRVAPGAPRLLIGQRQPSLCVHFGAQEAVLQHGRAVLRLRHPLGHGLGGHAPGQRATGRNVLGRQAQMEALHLDEARQVQRRNHALAERLPAQQHEGNLIALGVEDAHAPGMVGAEHVQRHVHALGARAGQRIGHADHVVVHVHAVAAHVGGQQLHAPLQQAVSQLGDAVEAILHVAMHRVLAASADGVVGVVPDEHAPQEIQMPLGEAAAQTGHLQRRVQRLEPVFQQVLKLRVADFQIDSRGIGVLEGVVVHALKHLAHVQAEAGLLQLPAHGGEVALQRVLMDFAALGQARLHLLQHVHQVVLRLDVVAAVHQQQEIRLRDSLEMLLLPAQQLHGLVDIRGEALGVVVPEAHADGEDLGAVGALPAELCRGHALGQTALIVHAEDVVAAAEHAGVQPDAV